MFVLSNRSCGSHVVRLDVSVWRWLCKVLQRTPSSCFKTRTRFVLEISPHPHGSSKPNPPSVSVNITIVLPSLNTDNTHRKQHPVNTRRNGHEEEMTWGQHTPRVFRWGGATRIHSAMKARGVSSKEDSSLWKIFQSSCLGVNDKKGGGGSSRGRTWEK